MFLTHYCLDKCTEQPTSMHPYFECIPILLMLSLNTEMLKLIGLNTEMLKLICLLIQYKLPAHMREFNLIIYYQPTCRQLAVLAPLYSFYMSPPHPDPERRRPRLQTRHAQLSQLQRPPCGNAKQNIEKLCIHNVCAAFLFFMISQVQMPK